VLRGFGGKSALFEFFGAGAVKSLGASLGADISANFGLRLFGQVNDFVALGRASAFVFGRALRTLQKQQVAGLIGAVAMPVPGASALVAVGNYVVAHTLAKALVKYKIHPHKGVVEVLVSNLANVVDYASVQLIDVLKAVVLEVGRGFFAADPSSTIKQYGRILFAAKLLKHLGKFLFKGVGFRQKRTLKMPYLRLIMIPHVYYYGGLILRKFIPLSGTEVPAYVGHVVLVFA
jgi:hypothetical protein